uniref:EF-hand domain-containing protein n=1 Tax=Globisporangium ultimum (strain ATCC 200006 / CBS 805.95 / DAOM BR144) TaxID=431595 RepID=K3W928_GLOUD
MANVRAPARSIAAIHSYLSDRSRACDAHIDALHQTIQQSRKPKVAGVLINNTHKPITRASPTKSSYSHGNSSNSLKRSILKKTPPQETYDKAESVEQWFQRVLRTKQLSPLDLCDLFSYGDARRHATVPLRHVCDVLFDLDPDGRDPVSPDMEVFLSNFAFEDAAKGGDIVVNVKDALRALNIWQSGTTSSKTSKAASSSMKPSASRSPERPQRITQSPPLSPQQRVLLETKNKKLLGVIASLEDANLQLSQQLKDAATGKEAPRPPSKVHSMVTTSTGGVKQLEELLLPESDTNTTGFVSLRQLRWLLAEKFHVENVTETLLMEMCLGMNFNAQSQVDAREFVHVLLDVLIYASTPPRRRRDATSRDLLRTAIQQYLGSDGFDASADPRMMLTALCIKYDLERDARISVSEIMRVLYHDLPAQHTTHASFPLAQNDALSVLEPFVKEQPSSSSNHRQRGFLSYPDLVEWMLASPTDEPKDTEDVMTARALDWGFWAKLRTILCSGNATNRALESKIHVQLCKIFKKLDPRRTFCVSQHHFLRVVDNHIDANDLAVVTSVLTDTDGGNGKASEHDTAPRLLRYDVFMKLVFGVPALQTDPNRNKLFQRIARKLRHADKAHEGKDGVDENATKVSTVRTALVAWLQKHGGAWCVTLPALHQLLCEATDHAHASSSTQLTMVELLFLFAHLDADHDGSIPLHSLWTFLKRECWRTVSDGTHRHGLSKRGNHQKRPRLEDTRRALTRCLRAYNLERALSSKYKHDSISQDQLLREIYDMLHVLGYDDDDDDVGSDQSDNPLDPAHLQQFLASIVVTANDADPELFRMGRLNLTIPIDALFDTLFDWHAVLHAMQLPHKLVDVKNTFERFDWHKNGSIALADWNKAWRQIIMAVAWPNGSFMCYIGSSQVMRQPQRRKQIHYQRSTTRTFSFTLWIVSITTQGGS